jgi:hypothetical protein
LAPAVATLALSEPASQIILPAARPSLPGTHTARTAEFATHRTTNASSMVLLSIALVLGLTMATPAVPRLTHLRRPR